MLSLHRLPRPCVPYACCRPGFAADDPMSGCSSDRLSAAPCHWQLRTVVFSLGGNALRLRSWRRSPPSFRFLFRCLFVVFSAVYLLLICRFPDVVRQSPCCVMRSIAAVRSSVSAPGHPMARTGTRPVASYASSSPARFASYLHPVRVAAVRLRIRLVVWPLPFAGGVYRFVRSPMCVRLLRGLPFDRFSRAGGCSA